MGKFTKYITKHVEQTRKDWLYDLFACYGVKVSSFWKLCGYRSQSECEGELYQLYHQQQFPIDRE